MNVPKGKVLVNLALPRRDRDLLREMANDQGVVSLGGYVAMIIKQHLESPRDFLVPGKYRNQKVVGQ